MKQIGSVLFFLCFCLTFTASASSPNWVSSGGSIHASEPAITTMSEGYEQIKIEVEIPGFLIEKTKTKAGSFDELVLPGQSWCGEIGQAKLPALRLLFEVPHGAHLSVSLDRCPTREIALSDIGIQDILVPNQEPILKTEDGYEQWTFSKDEAFYAHDAYTPIEQITIEKEYFYRGHRIVQVLVKPIIYNPVQGKIRLSPHMTGTLYLPGGHLDQTVKKIQRTWSPAFEQNLAEMVLNYGMMHTLTAQSVPKSSYWDGLLIISAPAYYAAADQIAQWRVKTGYRVSHVTTTETGSSVAAIKAYIQSIYDSWTSPSLSFVMLVGDVDTIPAPDGVHCYNCASDSDYACLEGGDNVHDVYISRVSVNSPEQADTVFDRFMTYAKASFGSNAWIKKACFSSSCDSTYNEYHTHEVCLADYTQPAGYTGTYYPGSTDPGGDLIRCIEDYNYDATTSGLDVVNALNAGRSLITYSGHCGSTSWSGPTVTVSQIQGANPGDMSPFMTGHCCSAHSIRTGTCMGEACIREVAIGYFGSSEGSTWGEDDYLQIAWFDKLFTSKQHRLAEYTINGLIDFYNNYSSSELDYYMDMEIVAGDPTMELYTKNPGLLTLTHTGTIFLGQSTYTVNVKLNGFAAKAARVCLMKTDGGDDIHAFGLTDTNGNVTFTFDPAPAAVGTMMITATAINAKPIEGSALVIVPSGPWCIYNDHQIDDSAANGNGSVNPGETVVVAVALENIGPQAGTAINATIASSSSYCSVLDNAAAFQDIPSSGIGWSLPNHFSFSVDALTPNNTTIPFTLDWTASGGNSGTTYFDVQVVKPILEYVQSTIDDGAGGNGNGYLEAGETVAFAVVLSNQGGCAAQSIQGTLSHDSSYVTLNDNQANWPDMDIGQNGQTIAPHFNFSTASETPAEHVVNFTVNWLADGGFSGATTFSVMVVAPDLQYQAHLVDDSSSGNNNNFLDPGETATLSVCLINQGGCPATGVQATLIHNSPYLSFAIDQANWPDIGVSESAYSQAPSFSVTAAPDTPMAHCAVCQLSITTAGGYSFTDSFNLYVGTRGFVLVIDDDSNGASSFIAQTLIDSYYQVEQETAAETNPSTWSTYGFIVYSSGDNSGPIAQHTTDLVNYVQAGGKLLLEGGEILYDHYSNATFRSTVLHCNNWQHDGSGQPILNASEHPVAFYPNVLPSPMSCSYGSYYYQDSGDVAVDAQAVFTWSSYPTLVSIMAFDDDEDVSNGGQIIFWLFNINHLNDLTTQQQLIQNSAAWLNGEGPNSEVPTLSWTGIVGLLVFMGLAFSLIERKKRLRNSMN
ncbi:hypothetical protein JXQ70_10460 [bacterium]|nr:hypothetical protein [bacterium]